MSANIGRTGRDAVSGNWNSLKPGWTSYFAIDPRGVEYGRFEITCPPTGGEVFARHTSDLYEVHFLTTKDFNVWAAMQGLKVLTAIYALPQDTEDLKELVGALREWFKGCGGPISSSGWDTESETTWGEHIAALAKRLGIEGGAK